MQSTIKSELHAYSEQIAGALNLEPGMVVLVAERCGRPEIMAEILLAIEARGATPLVDYLPPDYLVRLLSSAEPALLADWDRHRRGWMETADRLLVLGGDYPDFSAVPADALAAWRGARERLTRIEEGRRLPMVLVAIPTEQRAASLGMTLADLEAMVLPAIATSPALLQQEIDRLLPHLQGAGTITIENPNGTRLTLDVAGRAWHTDTGLLPEVSEIQPVVNLPAGSLYSTVVEESVTGRLFLPMAGGAREVTLTFESGRIVGIEAVEGAGELAAMFDQHSGEPRRISHIGIGLNPALDTEVNWPLVDEHRHGSLFIAFGENRYLGGHNASSLNIDFVAPHATIIAGDQTLVDSGRIIA